MRSNMLQTVLNDLNGTSADIEASAIISSDGLMMAALLPNTVDEDRVGAMSAAMLSLGDRTARGTRPRQPGSGPDQRREGYVLMVQAGADAVHRDGPNAKLGLVFLDVRRAATPSRQDSRLKGPGYERHGPRRHAGEAVEHV